MGLALLTSVVCLVPTTALGAWVASQEPATAWTTGEFGVYGLAGTYLPGLGSLISTVALTGFLAYVIGQAVLGRKVGIGETWDGTKRRLPAVAGAVLVTLVGGILLVLLMLGLPILLLIREGAGVATVLLLVLAVLLAIVVYLWLWTRLAFVTAVIVLEGRGVAAAFARSWRLTSGRPFWRILGIRFLTAAVVGVAANVITLPITLIGIVAVIALGGEDRLFMWQAILTGLATLVSGAITTPFSAGIDALMTVDQRIRREGPRRPAHPRGPVGRPRPVAERRSGALNPCASTPRWTPPRPRRGSGSRTSCARASTASRRDCSRDCGAGCATSSSAPAAAACPPGPPGWPSSSPWRSSRSSSLRSVRAERRMTGPPADGVLDGPSRTAAQHRSDAGRALAVGDADTALLEAYRAIARSAVERTLLDDLPGRTAHEVAVALGPLFPASTRALADAADAFDAVRYGRRAAGLDTARAVLDLDATLAAARPVLAGPAPLPGTGR